MGARSQVRKRRRAPFSVEAGKLPEDPAALKELLVKLSTRALSMCDRLEQTEDRLHAELLRRFGPRSERYPFHPGQGSLFEGLLTNVSPETTEPAPEPDDEDGTNS